MREIKTVKGYINALKRLSENTIMNLKGFDDLPEDKQESLKFVSGELANSIGELDT